MNEQLLFAYLQEHGPFAEWVVQYPLLADQVVSSLITLNTLNGSSAFTDLLACRDAALTLQMIARSGGFDDVAAVFSMQYDQFARAVLPFRRPGCLMNLHICGPCRTFFCEFVSLLCRRLYIVNRAWCVVLQVLS